MRKSVEDKTVEMVASDNSRIHHRLNVALSIPNRLSQVKDAICIVLKYPLLFALLSLDFTVLIPSSLWVTAYYSFYLGFLFLILTQSPIIYMVIQRIRREEKLKAGDHWEINPERWRKAVDEYVGLIKKKSED